MQEIKDLDFLSLQETTEEQSYNFTPKTFDDYLGQKEMSHFHLLLFGPPGLGKTTLLRIMAQMMNVGIKICSGPILPRGRQIPHKKLPLLK